MSRNPRLPSVAFGWYYFGRKAAKGRKIFTNQAELDRFRGLLIATLAGNGVRIHFVDLRPRAMHLGLHAGESPITQATGSFCQKCALEINRIRRENGPLFRPHAVRRLVQPGERFIGLGRCIHCAAEFEEKGTGEAGRPSDEDGCHPDEQPLYWSTKAVYLNGGCMLGVDASVIRRIVAHGSRDREAQHRACVIAFAQPPTASEVELFRRGSPEDPRFVGSADFIAAKCRELGVKPRPRQGHYSNADAEMHRTTVRLIEAFRRMGDEHIPAALAEKWEKWKEVATLANVCSESRKQPAPMLRGLAASRMRSRGIPQRLVEGFLRSKPRTLAAGRRHHYQMKFKRLFGRSYEDLFGTPRESGRILTLGVGSGDATPQAPGGADARAGPAAGLRSAVHRDLAPGTGTDGGQPTVPGRRRSRRNGVRRR
jgi:hypothetical protein